MENKKGSNLEKWDTSVVRPTEGGKLITTVNLVLFLGQSWSGEYIIKEMVANRKLMTNHFNKNQTDAGAV